MLPIVPSRRTHSRKLVDFTILAKDRVWVTRSGGLTRDFVTAVASVPATAPPAPVSSPPLNRCTARWRSAARMARGRAPPHLAGSPPLAGGQVSERRAWVACGLQSGDASKRPGSCNTESPNCRRAEGPHNPRCDCENPVLFDARSEPRMKLYRPDGLHFHPPAYDEFAGIIKPVLTRAWRELER
jgi:hypothetical protein